MSKAIWRADILTSSLWIRDVTPENLLRINQIGDLAPKSLLKDVKRIHSAIQFFDTNIDELLDDELEIIALYYSNYIDTFKPIYELNDKKFVDSLDFIRAQIIEAYNRFRNEIEPILLSQSSRKKFQSALEKSEQFEITIEDFLKLVNQTKEEAKAAKDELAEATALKNSLEQLVAEQTKRQEPIQTEQQLQDQSGVFKKLSEKNRQEATTWLYFIISSGILLVWVLFYIKENFCFDFHCFSVKTLSSYNVISGDAGNQLLWFEMFKAILFRLLIISANIFLLGFCVKNYNACMHNKTLNELRQNSFDAALHFYRTTTGQKKDEILLKAADAIFSHRTTGYNSKTGDENVSVYKSLIEKLIPGKE